MLDSSIGKIVPQAAQRALPASHASAGRRPMQLPARLRVWVPLLRRVFFDDLTAQPNLNGQPQPFAARHPRHTLLPPFAEAQIPPRNTKKNTLDDKGLHWALALLLVSIPAAVWAGLTPGSTAREVAMIAAPGKDLIDTAQIVAMAGGELVAAGRFDNIVLVRSNTPGLAHRLYHSGAWLVLSANGLSGCLGLTNSPDGAAGEDQF